MTGVNILIGVFFLAAFNERAVEWLFGQWKTPEGHSRLGNFLPYIAAAVGILECLLLRINALPLVDVEGNVLVGQVITGIVVGMGSNAVHRFFANAIR